MPDIAASKAGHKDVFLNPIDDEAVRARPQEVVQNILDTDSGETR
jgi:hypothetical protein